MKYEIAIKCAIVFYIFGYLYGSYSACHMPKNAEIVIRPFLADNFLRQEICGFLLLLWSNDLKGTIFWKLLPSSIYE